MKETITKFYEAFDHLDVDQMLDCYHQDLEFEDPVFGRLKGSRACNMWRMLCSRLQGQDFKISVGDVDADANFGKATWRAIYTYRPTGRRIENHIEARFVFKDGKIIEHIDQFDLYRWASQALGLKGYLFGWMPFFRGKMQRRTNRLLDRFEALLDNNKL